MWRYRGTRKLSTEVRRWLMRHTAMHQTGGAIVEGDGIRYDYRTGRNGNTVVFRGGRKAGREECFLLLLERDGTAVLQWLKSSADCALDPGGTGRSMVAAALNLARKRGAKEIRLMDDSKKRTASDKSFRLSNVYFLTTGQTWYESVIPGLHPTEKEELVEELRRSVLSNTWDDVVSRLPESVDLHAVDITGIDTATPGSAMAVLQRIKASHSDFFADYEEKLLWASGVGNLYGLAWSASLA